MRTIDNLLHFIVDHQDFLNNFAIDQKTKKTLISLSRQLKKGHFFTEKQGRLLLSLLNEIKKEKSIKDKFNLKLLENPVWSQPFRTLEIVKKIYFENDKKTNFIVEFTYDKDLKRKVQESMKKANGFSESLTSWKYLFSVTEKNISVLFDSLIDDNFEIDETLLSYYTEIKKIQKTGDTNINGLLNQKEKIIECIKDEINNQSTDIDLILLDRRIRYQYTFEYKNANDSLTFKIANRKNPHVWIDSKNYHLEDIFNSLIELDRLPILLIFNKGDVDESAKKIETLKRIVDQNTDLQVGVYFRADNTSDINKSFNSSISNNLT
jgi:hypothetical protein